MKTLHLIGSKDLGGAENWFLRFSYALSEVKGVDVFLGIRAKSELWDVIWDKNRCFLLPFYTVWDPLSKYAIKKLINKIKPQIVQTYMSRATRLTKISPKDCVHVARLGGYYGLHAFRHAHAWIGNTKGICDYLINNGFRKDRVFYISNFVDIPKDIKREEQTQLRQKLKIKDDTFVMLTPARFVPVKGHKTLINAISLLLNDDTIDKNLKLILLGDGPLKDELHNLSQKLHVDNYIVWAGWQKDVSLYYSISDLVVFPSLEMETLGNVVLEAWSYRKPLVCTKFRGAREITKHLEDCIQAECGDENSLYKAIKLAFKNEELRNTIAKNGFYKVKEKYNRDLILKQYLEMYNYLLEKI